MNIDDNPISEELMNKIHNILSHTTILANQVNECTRIADQLKTKINECEGRLSINEELHAQTQETFPCAKSKRLLLYLNRLNDKPIPSKCTIMSSNYSKIFTMIDSLLFPNMYFLGLMEPYMVDSLNDPIVLSHFAYEAFYPFSCTKRCNNQIAQKSYCPQLYTSRRINQLYPYEPNDSKWNSFTLLSDGTLDDRRSYSLHISVTRTYKLDVCLQRPLNPIYRCGIRGNGELPLLGPNHCSCLIILTEGMVCLMKQRTVNDEVHWVLPKAFAGRVVNNYLVQDVLNGQNVLPLVLREAWIIAKPHITEALDTLFAFDKHMDAVEAGYLEHPLNTDNAWVELFLWKKQCNQDLEDIIADKNITDTSEFAWIPIDNAEVRIPEFDRKIIELYAS